MIRCHLSVLSLPREQRRPSRRSRQPIPPTSRSSKRQKALPLSFPHWTDRIFRFLKISSTNLPAVCAIISFTETHLTFVVIVIVKQILPRKARPRYFYLPLRPPGGGAPACRRPGARYFFRNYFTLTTLTNRKYAARATTASQSVRRWPQLLSLRKRYFSTCLCI